MTSFALLTLIASTSPSKAAEPCARNDDGSVTCDAVSFKKLTDHIVELRGKNLLLTQDLSDARANSDQFQQEMLRCQDALSKVPVPVVKPVETKIYGYVLTVLGSALATASVTADIPTDLRLPLAGVGAGALAAGLLWTTP